ncbi:AraC family transcriptional regulator [Oceanospirillum beijerinckii]|uniref:AraC family transcriptional regulator n=1 Tax=Oceanospirillum beijerinckii TaxID=64976 RepID=UPI00040628A7|nr:helix-turn-helix transcriptional regulator [Oceanospirillum beijerinckii]
MEHNKRHFKADKCLSLLEMAQLPRRVFVRQESMPPEHYFPAHQHPWHQLLYATSGVLTVDVVDKRLFISPEKAVWLPAGTEHSVATQYGAELKSLYIEQNYQLLADKSQVMTMTPLIKALIMEASEFAIEYPLDGYENEVISLILTVLPRLETDQQHLPWPSLPELYRLCCSLYDRPGDRRTTEELANTLSMSKRTLERRFSKATGISLQSWRNRLRFLKAVELLNSGKNITHIALELGYSSPSAFIYMFRSQTGISPNRYLTTEQIYT